MKTIKILSYEIIWESALSENGLDFSELAIMQFEKNERFKTARIRCVQVLNQSWNMRLNFRNHKLKLNSNHWHKIPRVLKLERRKNDSCSFIVFQNRVTRSRRSVFRNSPITRKRGEEARGYELWTKYSTNCSFYKTSNWNLNNQGKSFVNFLYSFYVLSK